MATIRQVNQVILTPKEMQDTLREKATKILADNQIVASPDSIVYFRNGADGNLVITLDPPVPPSTP